MFIFSVWITPSNKTKKFCSLKTPTFTNGITPFVIMYPFLAMIVFDFALLEVSSLKKTFNISPLGFFFSTNTVNPLTVSLNFFSFTKEGKRVMLDDFKIDLAKFRDEGLIVSDNNN